MAIPFTPLTFSNNMPSGYALDENFADIKSALQSALSREHSNDNEMKVDLDMNANRILNLPTPKDSSEAARLSDVQAALSGGGANLITFDPYDFITADNVQGAIEQTADKANERYSELSNELDKRVIYVDTLTDLQALPTSGLVVGQEASVKGSDFLWDGSAWAPTGPVNVKSFGVVADGTTDDSEAFEAALQSGYGLYADSDDIIKVTRVINTSVMKFDGRGCTIDGTEIPQTDVYGILIAGTDPEVVDVTASVDAGQNVASVSSLPAGVGEGTWMAVYDEADSSWSTSRTSYRAGEYAIIKSISGNDVTIEREFWDDYALSATLKVAFFTDPAEFQAKNFKCLFDETSENGLTLAFRIEKCLNAIGENIQVRGGYTPLSMKRCFGGEFRLCEANSRVPAGSGTAYGVIVGVSQNVDFYNCIAYSNNNHAFDVGGGGRCCRSC